MAVSVYVLAAIVRKRLNLDASLYQLLQILSLTLFEETPILRAFQANVEIRKNHCFASRPGLVVLTLTTRLGQSGFSQFPEPSYAKVQ